MSRSNQVTETIDQALLCEELDDLRLFEALLFEGVFDPTIFKVIFIAGGPGSGKGFVGGRTAGGLGFKAVNSDDSFERLMKKAGLSLDMEGQSKLNSRLKDQVRDVAKKMTDIKIERFIKNSMGIIIDGTGRDLGKLKEMKDRLEGLGYQSKMIFVDTSLDTALARNRLRDRTVPEDIVISSWHAVQNNKKPFQGLFGKDFILVRNDNATEDDFKPVWKEVQKFAKAKHTKAAKDWIEAEKAAKKRK